MELDLISLDEAVKEFNHWNGAARIYLDKNDGVFETSVYHNDVSMVESFSTDNYIAVFSKVERSKKWIKEEVKNYIIDYSKMILDGWELMAAEYQLMDKYPKLFL